MRERQSQLSGPFACMCPAFNMHTCFNLAYVLMGLLSFAWRYCALFSTTVSPIATHLVRCLLPLAARSDCTSDTSPSVCNDFAVHLPPHAPSGHAACAAPNIHARLGDLKQSRGKRKGATGNLLSILIV